MAETATWSEYYITQAGRILRQTCIAEEQTPVFTRAVIGTGKPTDIAVIDNMSGLVAYAKDVIIKKSYSIEANHLCIVRVDNSGYTQDVLTTEVAIYARRADQADEQAIVYGYAYCLDGYVKIPAQISTTNRKIYELTLDTYLSRSAEIKIVFDSSSLFVSHADLDDFAVNVFTLYKIFKLLPLEERDFDSPFFRYMTIDAGSFTDDSSGTLVIDCGGFDTSSNPYSAIDAGDFSQEQFLVSRLAPMGTISSFDCGTF